MILLEFIRQGVTNYWTESKFNSKYSYCDTYPEALWFPHDASLQLLIGSCNFRSKARLPALTYFYKPNSASICRFFLIFRSFFNEKLFRCAQPLAGFSARCIEDEALMELIMNANQTSSPLYLVDTRPRVNAMVNKVQGKGFEDIRNYTNMQFHFFDIENIHVMRGSLAKLLEGRLKMKI
jgi:myotubularin-related protein 6/7/8